MSLLLKESEMGKTNNIDWTPLLDEIQDIYDAALDLIDCVEKYVRQETSRATLIWKKEKLKRLIEK